MLPMPRIRRHIGYISRIFGEGSAEKIPRELFMGMDVDEFCLQLGVQDGLAAVEPAVAGEQVAEGAGGGEIDQTAGTEELDAEDDGGDGAVHRAAEHGHQADSGGKGGRQAQQSAEHAAEGRAHEERRHHLAALEAAADGDGGGALANSSTLACGMSALPFSILLIELLSL